MSSDPEGAGTAAPGQSDVSTGAGVGPSPKADAGDKGRADRARERFRGLPTHTFGPASEEPYRRRTSDWVRVAVAVVALAVARRLPRQSEPRESGPVPVLQRPPQRSPAVLPDAVLGGDALDCPGRRRGRVHRPSLAVGSRSHDRRAACRARGPGDGPARRRTVAVEDLRRGHAPRPVPAVPVGASRDRGRGRCRGVAVCDAADASPRAVARVRARVLGDVSGDGVSERHPRGAVPRVGRRGAGAPRVRLAGRAPDDASGRGITCGARRGGA